MDCLGGCHKSAIIEVRKSGAAWSDIKREAIMVSMSLCSYISFAIKYNELKTVKVCRAMTSSTFSY